MVSICHGYLAGMRIRESFISIYGKQTVSSCFGVPSSQIEVAGICTYIHHEEFFSARRLGIASGRILSGILIIN